MKIVQQEDLNFLVTNRIPRRLATRFVGWFSKIQNPLVCDCLHRLLAFLRRFGSERRAGEPVSQHA